MDAVGTFYHKIDCPANFYQSRIAKFPRRTCEALLDQTFYGQWVEENPLPSDANFDELLSWIKPLVEAENDILSVPGT